MMMQMYTSKKHFQLFFNDAKIGIFYFSTILFEENRP